MFTVENLAAVVVVVVVVPLASVIFAALLLLVVLDTLLVTTGSTLASLVDLASCSVCWASSCVDILVNDRELGGLCVYWFSS